MLFNSGMNIKRGDKLQKDKISFKDVAGLKEAKVEIMEYVDYIKKPENFTVSFKCILWLFLLLSLEC